MVVEDESKVTVVNDPDELVAKATPLRAEEEVEAPEAAEAPEGEPADGEPAGGGEGAADEAAPAPREGS